MLANEAANGYWTRKQVSSEISKIEDAILDASNIGDRSVTIDFTTVTDPTIYSFVSATLDVDTNTFTLSNHGYIDGDTVMFNGGPGMNEVSPSINISTITEYTVVRVDDNNFQISLNGQIVDFGFYVGQTSTTIYVRKITEAEKYLKSWDQFYSYENSEKYLNVLARVEEHFRKNGYYISRYKSTNNRTLFWLVKW